MGNSAGTAPAMEGIQAAVGALGALFLEDASLEAPATAACPGGDAGAVVDVLQRRYEIRLERMAAVKQLEARLAAIKTRDAAEAVDIQHAMIPPGAPMHERTYTEMSAVEEIAGVLTISSGAAGALLTRSRRLCSLPPALDALSAGTITWQHAAIIADETDTLSPDGATALAAHFLDPDAPNPARGAAAGNLVPARFRAKVRTWRERHHPETLEKRHAKCAADRRMEYAPDRDGMAWLSLYLPGDTACAIWNRTTALARGLQSPEEPRTLTQLRPDIAASSLLGAPAATATTEDAGTTDDAVGIGKVPTPKADVLITVPVFSLLGTTDEPADLDGLGPIPASMARKLLADGATSFHRVLVDPRDGAPLEIGRTSYRLTKAMKQALRLRDGRCTFPGCNNPTLDNEADHLQAWQHGGTTAINNLGQICPKHHRLKHDSGWEPTQATTTDPPSWTSPTGRHYKPEKPDWGPPHWPPGSLTNATETPGVPGEEPPLEEPVDANLEDPGAFSPDDPVWIDFYAMPPKLPEDPVKEEDWNVVHS